MDFEEAMTTRFTGDGPTSNSGGRDLAVGVQEMKEDQLVRHRVCRYAEDN
jgi:hypothetical protein